MVSFFDTDASRREIAPPTQIRRSPPGIVSICCQYVDIALVQHPMSPILGISAKSPPKRARGDLHPYPGVNQLPNRLIAMRKPVQTFRMGEDRNKPLDQHAKKKDSSWGGAVW
jgi:hypothetical protein